MATERMLVWEGISRLDGVTPVVVLATGVPKGKGRKSANAKTGDMIQIVILVRDEHPLDVLRNGNDTSICGTCPHRSKASGGSGACYVNVGQGPRSTWVSHQARGSVPFDLERLRGHKIRFGSYGDPATVPVEVWQAIADVARDGGGVTGYTHQWRTADEGFADFCMASADSADEGREARRKGYRNFIVRAPGEAKPKGSVVCPASEEAGRKIQCDTCMMCSGNGSQQSRDITIIAHGSTAKAFKSLPLAVA